MRLALVVIIGVAGWLIQALPQAAGLPPGLYERLIASGLDAPTAMQFAPDGRLFVCEQSGRIRVVKDGALLDDPFAALTVNAGGSGGLLGLAFDPDFAATGHVFVYYTAATQPRHNRISRLTASGDVAVPGSEVVIFELDDQETGGHNGGALHVGADGRLYAGVGENHNGAHSQTLDNLFGKILRIDRDGGIPLDNPFVAVTTGRNQAIWAIGLRNPFTLAIDAASGRLFINDVGQSTWEEINEGAAGANYGWPSSEGPTSHPDLVSPVHAYGHGASTTSGCAITGGTFYPAAGTLLPALAGRYVFADFCSGWIRHLDPQAPAASELLATGIDSPVDLKVGPDGALYYLARGGGTVFRIAAAAAGEHVLTVRTTGSGHGLVSSAPGAIWCPGGSCTDAFLDGSVVSLTAEPSPGSLFTGWEGGCAGHALCTVTVDQAVDIVATFESQFDLVVTQVTNAPSAVRPGGSFSVTDTTRNDGIATTPATLVRYYLSADAVVDGADLRLQGSRGVAALAGGAESTGTATATIPMHAQPGGYQLLACADDTVVASESNEANNCSAAASVLVVARPDLIESVLSNPPGAVAPGGTFTATDTVHNDSLVAAPKTTTRFYLSFDAVKDLTDVKFAATRSVPALAANTVSTGTKTLKIPAATPLGAYFVIACADDTKAVAEASEANNCRASTTVVQVSLPNLVATAVTTSATQVRPGRSFSVTSTTRNDGTAGAPTTKTRYRLSADDVADDGDVLLTGSTTVSALASGGQVTRTSSVTVPTSTPNGTYFVLACADALSAVAESDETDNCRASATTVVISP